MPAMRITTRSIAVVALLCAAASALALLVAAQAARNIPPTRVATINLDELIDKLQEKVDWEIRLRQLEASIRDEVAAKKASLQTMVDKINAMTSEPEKRAAIEDAELVKLEMEQWAAMKLGELDREASLMWRRIYKHIKEESAKLAEAKGYDYVIVDEPGDDLTLNSGDPRGMPLRMQALEQINARRLIYTSPAHDITEELRARMDNAYAVGGPSTRSSTP